MKNCLLVILSVLTLSVNANEEHTITQAKINKSNELGLDVLGMKLRDDLTKKNACDYSPTAHTIRDSNVTFGYSVNCDIDGQFEVYYSRHKKLIFARRSKLFDSNTEWEFIKPRIIEKYGFPDKSVESRSSSTLCWGSCKKDSGGNLRAGNGDSLIVDYHNQLHDLSVFLVDKIAKMKNEKWYNEETIKYDKNQSKKQANNFVF
jgi:hypothetical protein